MLRRPTRKFNPVITVGRETASNATRAATRRCERMTAAQSASHRIETCADPTNVPKPIHTSIANANTIVRPQNWPFNYVGWDFERSLYTAEPVNFIPLRPVPIGFSSLDRATRDTPWESRFDIVNRRIMPKLLNACVGTPRREFQGGMVDGVRVRAAFNPYFVANKKRLRQWNTWSSRDFLNWDPYVTAVRGSFCKYSIPVDLLPTRDELGERHPPVVSSRYQADVKKQYIINSIPWVFEKNFMDTNFHLRDREPLALKRWYRREYRIAKIHETMKAMPNLVVEYRKARRAAKINTWFEKLVVEMGGDQASDQVIRRPKYTKA